MAELLPLRSWQRRATSAGTAAGVALLGALAAVAAARLAERGFGNAVIVPVGAITVLALLVLGLGAYRMIGAWRDTSVWDRVRHQEGLVFSSGRTRRLREALEPYAVVQDSESLGYDFTVSCTVTGLTFWGGPAREPVALAVIPWRHVVKIAPGRVSIDTRSSQGLHVSLSSGEQLELHPLGEGLVAAFPFSTKSLLRLSAQLSAMRHRWT